MLIKIGFGGGCHWCTEGVFQSLIGVERVDQGWIQSTGKESDFSEGVIVYFNPTVISLSVLVEIHLHTHASTANHSMRHKYRSAVYVFSTEQSEAVTTILNSVQTDFNHSLITQVLPFNQFKMNKADQLNYFYTNPNRPFCVNHIHPKLNKLTAAYARYLNPTKVAKSILKN